MAQSKRLEAMPEFTVLSLTIRLLVTEDLCLRHIHAPMKFHTAILRIFSARFGWLYFLYSPPVSRFVYIASASFLGGSSSKDARPICHADGFLDTTPSRHASALFCFKE